MFTPVEGLVFGLFILVTLLLVSQAMALGKLPKYTWKGIDFREMPTDISSVNQIKWIQKEYKRLHRDRCTTRLASMALRGWETSLGYKIHHGELKSQCDS